MLFCKICYFIKNIILYKENIKHSYINNKLKISPLMQNVKIELPDRSHSTSDIQDFFQCFIKKHETLTDNPPIRIFINKIENRITFKVETGYYKECLTLKTMKLLGSTKNEITKNENGDNVLHSEITEILLVHVLLVHCNRANNDYEHDS